MSDSKFTEGFITIETGKKFEILKKGKEYFIKANDNGVDLNEVNTILVMHNIRVTNFLNIRNAITTKVMEIVPFGTEMDKIVVTISNDGMKAYVTFHMTEAELLAKVKIVSDLQAILERKGINFGVNITKIVKAEKIPANTTITIAEGHPSKPGDDSIIKLYDVSSVLKPKELEDGSVNHYEIGIVTQIHQGEWVGEWTKPTDGEQ